MKERHEIRETLRELKARGEKIRESVLPKSITPEMVGGTLSGLAEAADETLNGLRLSVYGFDKILEDVPDDKGNIKTTAPDGVIAFVGGAFRISRKGNYELMPEGAYNKAEGDELTANGANLYMAGTEIYRVAAGRPARLERAFARPEESRVEIVKVEPEKDSIYTESGKYYVFEGDVDTLKIMLPAVEDDGVARSVGVFLTAGESPYVAIESTDSTDVAYFEGFVVDPGKTYELNIMHNGLKWIVAYGIVE